MSDGRRRWRVLLTDQAWRDLEDILRWTAGVFGPRQSRTYERTIVAAVDVLASGPSTLGVRRRDDVRPGLYSLHVARNRRRGRHFLFFKVARGKERSIEIVRILHDSMDLGAPFANDNDD